MIFQWSLPPSLNLAPDGQMLSLFFSFAHFSMMPLFMANFGSTLDALGEPPEPGDEETVVEQVESFTIYFGVIGLVSGVACFTMVTLFTIAGERQVTAC